MSKQKTEINVSFFIFINIIINYLYLIRWFCLFFTVFPIAFSHDSTNYDCYLLLANWWFLRFPVIKNNHQINNCVYRQSEKLHLTRLDENSNSHEICKKNFYFKTGILGGKMDTSRATQHHHHHHHHHHVAQRTRISQTLSRHPSLSSIAPGRCSRLHPVSAQGCCI